MSTNKQRTPEIRVSTEPPKLEARISIELPLEEYNYFDFLCHSNNTTIADVIRDAINSYVAKGEEETTEAYRKEKQADANLKQYPEPLSDWLREVIDPICEDYGFDKPDTTGWTLGQFFNWIDQLPDPSN